MSIILPNSNRIVALPPGPAEEGDIRRQVVATCAEALLYSPEEQVRKDAFQLLQEARGGC